MTTVGRDRQEMELAARRVKRKPPQSNDGELALLMPRRPRLVVTIVEIPFGSS